MHLALNVLSPFLAGFMIPGKPIGVMVFKVFSTITLGQAYVLPPTGTSQANLNLRQTYCQDLKVIPSKGSHFDFTNPS